MDAAGKAQSRAIRRRITKRTHCGRVEVIHFVATWCTGTLSICRGSIGVAGGDWTSKRIGEEPMSKNAMAGAVTLCGVGLCVIGAALMMQNGNSAHAAGGMPLAAVAAVAHAQAAPTVVWYSATSHSYDIHSLWRAWSDGTVEMRVVKTAPPSTCATDPAPCVSPWKIVNSPSEGYRAFADINADELVDGADLASILGNWGDAPRVPFPPSDCPLNLINP